MSSPWMDLIIIFVLAMIIGIEVIKKVPSLLHTPLMSGANAISGITIIGAMIVAGQQATALAEILGFIATVFAMVNVMGGYIVTDRMLKMFRKNTGEKK